MRVSIVTAVLDGAAVIARTLDSVAEQDYPSIEHIVIDGASSDGTLDVVRAHGRRVAVVQSARDGGVYQAFNKGLRAASGDVIAFLNAGDTYANSSVVSRLMREFDDPSVGAAFGDLDITDPLATERVLRRYRCGRFDPEQLASGFMPAHPTLFLRRDVYERAGHYDERFRIAGDYELCLRVFAKLRIRFRHVPAFLVRMPSGGMSNRGLPSAIAITREMHRACAQNGVDTNWFRLLMRLPRKALSRFVHDE
jgi:glycosyltransferase involved in cell wall biosynthesis